MEFETSVIEQIGCYVYVLIDPESKQPFYIGKGTGNRVFDHARGALRNPKDNAKYETITEIRSRGKEVEHLIIRHGLSSEEAHLIESALIDFAEFQGLFVTNKVLGHKSINFGLMTSDEIVRKYKAEPLTQLDSDCVLININKTYKRAKGSATYYEATKERWAINKRKLSGIKFALAEYRGFIVEVFQIQGWYAVPTVAKSGKERIRWGFNGHVAEESLRNKYLNKSVQKKRGQTNPIRYEYMYSVPEVDNIGAIR